MKSESEIYKIEKFGISLREKKYSREISKQVAGIFNEAKSTKLFDYGTLIKNYNVKKPFPEHADLCVGPGGERVTIENYFRIEDID